MFTRRELERALDDQGFVLVHTNLGTRVQAPDGIGTASYHPSVFGKQATRRSYQNMLSSLENIGFDWRAATTPKSQKREKGLTLLGPVHPEPEPQPEPVIETVPAREMVIAQLGDLSKEAYDLIVANPGAHLRDLVPKMADNPGPRAAGLRISTLVKHGLVRRTGKTLTTQYWPTEGELTPSPVLGWKEPKEKKAGPVRVRQIEPSDPTVAYRRKAARAQQLASEIGGIYNDLGEAYQQAQEELHVLRRKVSRLEKILGNAVDEL